MNPEVVRLMSRNKPVRGLPDVWAVGFTKARQRKKDVTSGILHRQQG